MNIFHLNFSSNVAFVSIVNPFAFEWNRTIASVTLFSCNRTQPKVRRCLCAGHTVGAGSGRSTPIASAPHSAVTAMRCIIGDLKLETALWGALPDYFYFCYVNEKYEVKKLEIYQMYGVWVWGLRPSREFCIPQPSRRWETCCFREKVIQRQSLKLKFSNLGHLIQKVIK